jgi:hypothetical protein
MKQGDKVICVNNKNLQSLPSNFDKPLVEGAIYHVREMVPGYDYPGQPDGVMLDEIKGKIQKLQCHDGQNRTIEVHFRQNRFRVIEELDVKDQEEIRTELITILKTK